MSAPAAPARLVAARFLVGTGCILFGGDIFWCLLARGSVSVEGYNIGMMLLSALGVVTLAAGGVMIGIHILREDHAAGGAHFDKRLDDLEACLGDLGTRLDDLGGDTANVATEVEAMRARLGDFIKLYDPPPPKRAPRQARATATKSIDEEAAMLAEAVELGKTLEAERQRRKDDGGTV